MVLKAVYETLEEIPVEYQALYSEKKGKYELTGIEGVKTVEDVNRLQGSLSNEREEHRKTKARLAAFNDMDPDDIRAKLDAIPALEAAASGKMNDKQVQDLIAARVAQELGPVQRKLQAAEAEAANSKKEAEELRAIQTKAKLDAAVTRAATASKVHATAIEDILLTAAAMFEFNDEGEPVTKMGVGVTPGVAPDVWLTEMQAKRPHWWPPSQGSGATGGGTGSGINNPWSKKNWNVTQQGAFIKQYGMEKANQYARAAGTTVGGPMPEN